MMNEFQRGKILDMGCEFREMNHYLPKNIVPVKRHLPRQNTQLTFVSINADSKFN